MSIFDVFNPIKESTNEICGITLGIVYDNQDPEGLGRIRIKYPLLGEEIISDWARVLSPATGNNRGIFFLPQIEQEVIVSFLYGNVDMPYVIGSVWNGVDLPPVSKESQQAIDQITTKGGHVIKFDNTQDNEKITIKDKNENQIVIDVKNNKINVISQKDIEISATKGSVTINAANFSVNATEAVSIKANEISLSAETVMNISGQEMVNIN